MKVLVLGAGKMVSAIMAGLKLKNDLSEWLIYSPSGVSSKSLAEKAGAKFISNISEAELPDWILIGCKPQQLNDLKEVIGDRFKSCLFVSILAAVDEKTQMNALGIQKLIRVMPNLPVEYGHGICLLSSNSSSEKLSHFQTVFSDLGSSYVVNEDELDELTLLTGSGPALFYEFAKYLSNSFNSLSDHNRVNLVRQTMIGAAVTLQENQKKLDDLINDVTSKKGVTIAVLDKWRELNIQEFVKNGVDAGRKRSTEISKSIIC